MAGFHGCALAAGGQHLFLTYEDQAVPVVWAAICKQGGVSAQLEACGGPLAKILFLSTTMASAAARLAASRISSSTRFAHLCTTTGWQPASLAWHTIARMHAAQMAVHPQAPGGLAGRLLPRVLPQAGHTIGRFLPGPGARPAPEGPLMAAPSVCPSVPPTTRASAPRKLLWALAQPDIHGPLCPLDAGFFALHAPGWCGLRESNLHLAVLLCRAGGPWAHHAPWHFCHLWPWWVLCLAWWCTWQASRGPPQAAIGQGPVSPTACPRAAPTWIHFPDAGLASGAWPSSPCCWHCWGALPALPF